jgi:heme A synthase
MSSSARYDRRTRRRFTRIMLGLVAFQACIGIADVWFGATWWAVFTLALVALNVTVWRLHLWRYPICARCGRVTHRDLLARMFHDCGPLDP